MLSVLHHINENLSSNCIKNWQSRLHVRLRISVFLNQNYSSARFFQDVFFLEMRQLKTVQIKFHLPLYLHPFNQRDLKTFSGYILCVSQIFAAIMFVDDGGTKNPYQISLSLWWRQNWKPVKILGREINSEANGSPT